jgi:hypothetical protein
MSKMHQEYRDKKWCRKINNVERVDKNLQELKNKNNLIINLMFLFFLFFVLMTTGVVFGLKRKYAKKKKYYPIRR